MNQLQLTITIDEETYEQLTRLSFILEAPISDMIRYAIEMQMQQFDKVASMICQDQAATAQGE